MQPRFHLHCLIASGALKKIGDGKTTSGHTWVAGGNKFLFPVRGLSAMFRAKFLTGFKRLCAQSEISLPSSFSERTTTRQFVNRLFKKPWVVYSKAPFAEPRKLSAEELVKRFLRHVLPTGMMRIRHYGFLANRCRRRYLETIRTILGANDLVKEEPQVDWLLEWIKSVLGAAQGVCPCCGDAILKATVPSRLPQATGVATASMRPTIQVSKSQRGPPP